MPLVEDVYVLEKELGKYVFNRSQFFSCRHLLDIGFCRGEFSTVFLATHKQTKEQFAIKVIEKNDMDTSRLENEVSILKKVRHPHIIFLKEFFDTPKKLYLVMELYPSIHILIVFCFFLLSIFVLFRALLLDFPTVSLEANCSRRSSKLVHTPWLLLARACRTFFQPLIICMKWVLCIVI